MCRNESAEIAKREKCAVVRTTRNASHEGIARPFVRTEDLHAVQFPLAIKAGNTRTNGMARFRKSAGLGFGARVEYSRDDLPVSGTPAEHAADGVHDFGFGWRRTLVEKCRRCY
jgi:hypothetical protein